MQQIHFFQINLKSEERKLPWWLRENTFLTKTIPKDWKHDSVFWQCSPILHFLSQVTEVYMIGTSVMKQLKELIFTCSPLFFESKLQRWSWVKWNHGANGFMAIVHWMSQMDRVSSRHWGHGYVFLKDIFVKKKKIFCLLTSIRQMLFLTISN